MTKPLTPAGPRPTARTQDATRVLEAAKARFALAVAEHALELLELQLRIARQTENLTAANAAIDSLLDRALGRPMPRPVAEATTPCVFAGADPPRVM